MVIRVKSPGTALRSLAAGGLLAASLGLGTGFGAGGYGSGGDYEEDRGTGASQEEKGAGGGQVTGMVQSASLPPNVTPGWKIRVCSEKTKAQSITFTFSPVGETSKSKSPSTEKTYGTGGSGEAEGSGVPGGHGAQDTGTAGGGSEPGMGGAASDTALLKETSTWQSGDPSLIVLPEHLSMNEKIRIQATPDRKDAKSEVCVLYNDHVAKKISFDETNTTTVKTTDNGTCGC